MDHLQGHVAAVQDMLSEVLQLLVPSVDMRTGQDLSSFVGGFEEVEIALKLIALHWLKYPGLLIAAGWRDISRSLWAGLPVPFIGVVCLQVAGEIGSPMGVTECPHVCP